jgi:hypothetical protein
LLPALNKGLIFAFFKHYIYRHKCKSKKKAFDKTGANNTWPFFGHLPVDGFCRSSQRAVEKYYSEGFYLFMCHVLHPVFNMLPFSFGDILYTWQ